MKLYWGPHTCAIGIHVLLEEIGAPYETETLDVGAGATHRPPFSGLNPKGKVPTLVRDDGSVLTEFAAIATWLARTHPETNLLPADPEIEARVVETMAYVEGAIHGQGYGRLFMWPCRMRRASATPFGAVSSIRGGGEQTAFPSRPFSRSSP